jgi:glyoxylase-like metal-dependent hydrolase (beta-lactamase superfamily II)
VLYSREDAERSLERLRGLARDTDALVILGHDAHDWSRLEHAPDAYN